MRIAGLVVSLDRRAPRLHVPRAVGKLGREQIAQTLAVNGIGGCSASIANPRSRAVVNAMTGSPWLWQVKHCLRFSIEPRAAFSKSGSDFATAALMVSGSAAGAAAAHASAAVRALPEWKDFMDKGAFKATTLSGPEFFDWLGKNEQLHRSLMKDAGFIAN